MCFMLLFCCSDWVLSHWVHFTVHSLDLVVFICVYFVFFFILHILLCYLQHSGVDLIGLNPGPYDFSSFNALTLLVGSFFSIKPVPDMTYNVFGGTLNLAQLNSTYRVIDMSTAPVLSFVNNYLKEK